VEASGGCDVYIRVVFWSWEFMVFVPGFRKPLTPWINTSEMM
jgi:hypothetical protein